MFKHGIAALAPEAQVAYIESETRQLKAALASIREIAARNEEHHTGFVHIRRIVDAWIPESNRDKP